MAAKKSRGQVTVDIPQQWWIEEISRQEPKETAAARREYEKWLTEAWKKKPRQPSCLAVLIQQPDVPIKDIAAVLRWQCAPQWAGKPFGPHLRWQRPHYLVAWLVELSSCAEQSKDKDESIRYWIKNVSRWAFMRGKTPLDPEPGGRDHERVKTLLRGPKRRRL